MSKFKKIHFYIFCGTLSAMIPAYLIRHTESAYMFLFRNFSTYPGDLWNFFTNYLSKGMHYPPEYPAGLRFFYELFGFYKYTDYTWFFTVNTFILAIFALATTHILYLSLKNYFSPTEPTTTRPSEKISNLWYFWILAPSFIFYGTINYDLPIVFLIVLSIYLFSKEKYYSAILWLAVGMVVKVFPIFFLPLFIWKSPTHIRLRLIALFITIVVALNLPYAISNFSSWIFPYIWQISSNLTTGPSQGTYWWILYPITGKLTGWISLALFGGLYLWTCIKMNGRHFFDIALAIIILFLLTDRIYSPQYNLYLLPLLVMVTYPINKKLFYTVEFANLMIVFFCFFLKDHPLYLQIFVFIRYIALIGLLYINLKQNKSFGDSKINSISSTIFSK